MFVNFVRLIKMTGGRRRGHFAKLQTGGGSNDADARSLWPLQFCTLGNDVCNKSL